MRPLKSSLTPDEITRLLGIAPEVLDALIDSGRILCQVRRGQSLVPLDQLEAFFRDSLIRLYEIEAGASGTSWQLAEQPVDSQPLPDIWEHAELLHAEDEDDPFGTVDSSFPPAEPFLPVQELPAVMEAAREPVAATEVIDNRPELRVAVRFVPLRQISGIFGESRFTVLQLSATGLRIRHQEPVLPGDEAKLSFALFKPARSVVIRARVVWTSIAKAGEERFSISGLRVIEYGERLVRALQDLNAAHELQPERRDKPRRENDALTMLSGIRDEEIAVITAAVHKFANDPVEANRWYARARFALSDENVRRLAPQHPREREEVLGIWEYLDRQIEISKVAGVVTWMRGVDKAGA